MINYFCIYFDATAVFILALSVNNKNKKTPVKLVIRRCTCYLGKENKVDFKFWVEIEWEFCWFLFLFFVFLHGTQ